MIYFSCQHQSHHHCFPQIFVSPLWLKDIFSLTSLNSEILICQLQNQKLLNVLISNVIGNMGNITHTFDQVERTIFTAYFCTILKLKIFFLKMLFGKIKRKRNMTYENNVKFEYVFINKVLPEHNHSHLLVFCMFLIFLTADYL